MNNSTGNISVGTSNLKIVEKESHQSIKNDLPFDEQQFKREDKELKDKGDKESDRSMDKLSSGRNNEFFEYKSGNEGIW